MTDLSFPTAEEAEFAFYTAFECMDLDAMMAVWENSEAIVCIHPLGSRLRGESEVRESWAQIFRSGLRLQFRISAVQSIIEGDLAIRIVQERIIVLNAKEQPAQPIIATNAYRRMPEGGWRMVLHHASPAPPDEEADESTPNNIH